MQKEEIISELASKRLSISKKKDHLQLLGTIDVAMFGAKAWLFTLQQIGLKKGKDYLFELGYLMGKDAAQEVGQVLRKKGIFLPKDFELAENIIEVTGFGIVKIKCFPEKRKVGLEVIENPIMSFGKEMCNVRSLVCYFYAGAYSGFIGEFTDMKKCRLKVKQCTCRGGKKTIFTS